MPIIDWTIRRDIIHRVQSALSKALSANANEPQLVANMVWHISKAMKYVRLSSGGSIKTGGVFVHARPFVQCGNFPDTSQSSVEIGDLLLLRTGVENGKKVNQRALLLQAKKISKDTSIFIKPDNKNQHHLYAQWPPFTYVRSGGNLNGQQRHVTGDDLNDATKYLLISGDEFVPHRFSCPMCDFLRWPFMCVAWTARPTFPILTHHYCFVIELLEFILGNAGKAYALNTGNYNWDNVIEDLITNTARAKSVFMGRAAGDNSQKPRGCYFEVSETNAFLNLSSVSHDIKDAEIGDNPPEVHREWTDTNDGGAISVVEFVVHESKKVQG